VVEPGVLSLKELSSIRSGLYVKSLKKEIDLAVEHVMQCEVGFKKVVFLTLDLVSVQAHD
jgi:hypothetical protein